jgi:hypothetical protein
VVCDQSEVGKIILHKNGENAKLRRKLPTTHCHMWSSKTLCQSICEKKIKGAANGCQIFY